MYINDCNTEKKNTVEFLLKVYFIVLRNYTLITTITLCQPTKPATEVMKGGLAIAQISELTTITITDR